MGRTGDAAKLVHRAYVWTPDGQIHYRRAGPTGARSPLLLLYGGSPDAALEDFMAEMGRERSVIAPDLPGTGMSDPLRGAKDTAAQAGVMLEVVAELGLGMVDVIGVADGGPVTVEMARQQSDVVRRVVLVSTPAPTGLLSQPTLTLNLAGFPSGDPAHAAQIRAFLDG